ncbi:YmdB family metallophosphoesterase [Marinibaculum pumilum]|uniref:YmdB family metallophosphoesterase n=1 Tax=Marinibaculum pumilum TaxID=1766165 RepID=A0ABV7L6L5_9PROT
MKLLYLGDVVGRSGREGVVARLPGLIERLAPDFVVVNGENAAGGFGITGRICQELYDAGVDCILTGNHVWDQKETLGYIDGDPRLLRPMNFPAGTPGRGVAEFRTRRGEKVAVLQVMGRLFMEPLDDPFTAVEEALNRYRLGPKGGGFDAILLDVHAEATSEKMALGHLADGRASLVCGTHTHVPTADAQILPGGTAYMTDAGMCGDYDSVIGMDKVEPLRRFRRKTPGARFEPAGGEATVCGVFVETEPGTGLARRIEPVRVGGRLSQALPGGGAAVDAGRAAAE